jgi:hypothetical protein
LVLSVIGAAIFCLSKKKTKTQTQEETGNLDSFMGISISLERVTARREYVFIDAIEIGLNRFESD